MTINAPTENDDEPINDYFDRANCFSNEQEVKTISWMMPTSTIKKLRTYVIGQYGTSQHIGAACTRAMINWMDRMNDTEHHTWTHLKNDYEYSDNYDYINEFTYQFYTRYKDFPVDEKSSLTFSIPARIINEFTAELKSNEYGEKLANAVEAEITKKAQIDLMLRLIEEGKAVRTDEEPSEVTTCKPVHVDADGNRDLSTITMDNLAARLEGDEIEEFAENNDIDWENRRGLLAAYFRLVGTVYTRSYIYAIDKEYLGIESQRTRRKDYNAFIKHIESNPDDVLSITMAKRVKDELETHNLQQVAGLTSRKQVLNIEFNDTVHHGMMRFDVDVVNTSNASTFEINNEFLTGVADIGYELIEFDYTEAPDSVTRTYQGMKQKNCISKYVPVVETTRKVLNDEFGFDERDVDEDEEHREHSDYEPSEVEALSKRYSRLSGLLILLKQKRDDITGPRGQTIEAAYEHCRKEGEKPQSREFKRGKKTTDKEKKERAEAFGFESEDATDAEEREKTVSRYFQTEE